MTPLDRDLLNSPDPREGSGPAEAVSNQVLEDEDACDEQGKVAGLAAKVVELRESNHKLLVDMVALRARNEQLKSKSSLERKFLSILGLLLWFLFLYVIVITICY
jgi:hypothetical protein